MTEQIWKHCGRKKRNWKQRVFSCALVSLVLSAPLSMAQTKRTVLGRRGVLPMASHQPQGANDSRRASGPALIPDASASYSFSYIDYPQAPYTYTSGTNYGASDSKMEIVGAYYASTRIHGIDNCGG